MRVRYWLLNIALICSTVAGAESAALKQFLSAGAIQYANVGVQVRRLSTGQVTDSYRSGNLIPPASVMKLLTTTTALEVWGEHYRIPTELRYSGTIRQGVLYGNLYIKGYGDPTLGGRDWENDALLQQWVDAVRKAGIQRIEGHVTADVSYYDGDAMNPGWLYEDMGNYYAPGIYALAYLDNSMNIQLRSGAIGTTAQVIKTFPTIPGLEFENHIRCTEIDYDGAWVHGLPYQNCRYLTGSIPSNHGVFGIRGDIPNPPLLLAQHLTQALRTGRIEVKDSAVVVAESNRKPTTLIYTHYSPTLQEIVEQTNLHSINLNAEMLFRNLAAQTGVPCTIKNSANYIKQFWRNRGVDIYTAQILDGCGLSPQNGVSAENLVNLLTYMARSTHFPAFYQSLPISGKSGTLKQLLAKTELEGKVHAKSGTIKGTRNYAGYISLPDGDKLVFAIMVNCSNASNAQIKCAIEKYLLNVYRANK